MKTIGITGGTGLVGNRLSKLLIDKGYKVIIFTRSPKKHKNNSEHISYAMWKPDSKKIDVETLKSINSIVHLAGASVADKRWTKERKQEIYSSRVDATNFLSEQIIEHSPNLESFISASAIGIYGADSNEDVFTEASVTSNDFLGKTCSDWEASSEQLEHQTRRIVLRIGIVLSTEGSAFKEFNSPTKFGLYPILGSGKQIVSWIHIDDLVDMILFSIEDKQLSGIYNAVAPNPVSNAALMRTIGDYKKAPKIFAKVPKFILKLMLGEMSIEILKSCTVSAASIEKSGFKFKYEQISDAVKQLLSTND